MFAILEMNLFDQILDFETLKRKINYAKSKCLGVKVKIIRTI